MTKRPLVAFDIDGTIAKYMEPVEQGVYDQSWADSLELLDVRAPNIINELMRWCNVGIVTARGYHIDSIPWLAKQGIKTQNLHFYAPAIPPSVRPELLKVFGVDLLIDNDKVPGELDANFCPPQVALAPDELRWDVIEGLLIEKGWLYPQFSIGGPPMKYVN